MTWINPLDKLPQIRQDYANHIIYGGLMGFTFLLLGIDADIALLISFIISVLKKIVDYFKEGEGIGICVAKTFVTVLFPLLFYIHTQL
jgi:hypothetical protein